jgi:hypothetical protein
MGKSCRVAASTKISNVMSKDENIDRKKQLFRINRATNKTRKFCNVVEVLSQTLLLLSFTKWKSFSPQI